MRLSPSNRLVLFNPSIDPFERTSRDLQRPLQVLLVLFSHRCIILLRIDAYPAFAPPDQEPQTFYACLASTSSKNNANADADDANDDTGRIFTVGRKVGDALFADKSVSREHCFLRLVSANKTHQQAVHLDNDSTNTGKTVPPPARPRNAREINACAADEQHECLVLENVGKVGSFIVQERVVRRAATKKDDADSATEDDETDDDEDNSHESQVAAASQAHTVELSPAARAIVADPSKVFLQQVGASESGRVAHDVDMLFPFAGVDLPSPNWQPRGVTSCTVLA